MSFLNFYITSGESFSLDLFNPFLIFVIEIGRIKATETRASAWKRRERADALFFSILFSFICSKILILFNNPKSVSFFEWSLYIVESWIVIIHIVRTSRDSSLILSLILNLVVFVELFSKIGTILWGIKSTLESSSWSLGIEGIFST